MAEIPFVRMRRDLGGNLPPPDWPHGITLCDFSAGDAPAAHALMQQAYAGGVVTLPFFGEWWDALSSDGEYDPALCFVARADDGQIIGFAQCWTSGFVKDLVVHPDWRRRGIGRALLAQLFQTFKDRGAGTVDLKVAVANRGAASFYQSLGMAAFPGPAGGEPD